MAIIITCVFLLSKINGAKEYFIIIIENQNKFCTASQHNWSDLSSYEFTYDLQKVC